MQQWEIYMSSSNDDTIRLLIQYMARDGLNEEEIAKRLKKKVSYIRKLIKSDENIIRDMEYAKLLTDYKVEDMLLTRAVGTTLTEVKETEKNTGTEVVTNTKDVVADTSAIQFWLKNRCPQKWNDKGTDNSDTIERLEKIFSAIDDKAKKMTETDDGGGSDGV